MFVNRVDVVFGKCFKSLFVILSCPSAFDGDRCLIMSQTFLGVINIDEGSELSLLIILMEPSTSWRRGPELF